MVYRSSGGSADADAVVGVLDAMSGHKPAPRIRKTSPLPPWREEGDAITFLLWSDGTEGLAWVNRLTSLGHRVVPEARSMLRHQSFVPTNNRARVVVVLKGTHVLGHRTVNQVRWSFPAKALLPPPAELGPLLQTQVAGQHYLGALGLSHIVIAHPPIDNRRLVVGDEQLFACGADDPIDLGQQSYGVAFMVHDTALPSFAQVAA